MEKSLKIRKSGFMGLPAELENEHPHDWNWLLTPLLLQDQFFHLDY